jgi:chromosome segregation ATPase
MTLFAYRFPLEMVFRIMDIVMAEGYDAVLRFSLALIQRNQTAILGLSEFENLLDFLQNGLFDEYIGDINSLISDAYQIQISKATLDILTNQHNEILRISSPDYIEAKELKMENMALNDKLQFLQADYEAICRDQAQMMGKCLEMEEEIEKLKDRNHELEENVEGLKFVLADERKGAEAQVQMEMDLLAQKNIRLTNQNAQLEEEIARLESDLATYRSQHLAAETRNEALTQKISKFQELLN